MYCGKTTWLIQNYIKIRNKTVIDLTQDDEFSETIAFKPEIDTRNSNVTEISAHSDSPFVISNATVVSVLPMEVHAKYIFIDEGQFFTNLTECCVHYAAQKKEVYVAGLSGNFRRNPWPEISKLIPHADQVIISYSKCVTCFDNAPFTSRIVENDTEILVGGKEYYKPTCRTHFK